MPDLFPPESRDAVDGLAWLGHLEHEVHFAGHRFLIRTLKGDEELIAALLAKDYQESYGQVKAQTWAHLAACVVAVDGDTAFCPPIGPDPVQYLRKKFEYMTSNWYWPVAAHLFDNYAQLVQRQADAIEAISSLSSRSLPISSTTVDSSNEQENSEEASTASNSESSSISPEQMRTLTDDDD